MVGTLEEINYQDQACRSINGLRFKPAIGAGRIHHLVGVFVTSFHQAPGARGHRKSMQSCQSLELSIMNAKDRWYCGRSRLKDV